MSEQLLARQADGELLLAALRRYLSMAEQQGPLSHPRGFYNDGMESSGPRKQTNSRPGLTAKTQVGTMKDPLTSVDGTFTPDGPTAVGLFWFCFRPLWDQ